MNVKSEIEFGAKSREERLCAGPGAMACTICAKALRAAGLERGWWTQL
jgi:hypothetical protein